MYPWPFWPQASKRNGSAAMVFAINHSSMTTLRVIDHDQAAPAAPALEAEPKARPKKKGKAKPGAPAVLSETNPLRGLGVEDISGPDSSEYSLPSDLANPSNSDTEASYDLSRNDSSIDSEGVVIPDLISISSSGSSVARVVPETTSTPVSDVDELFDSDSPSPSSTSDHDGSASASSGIKSSLSSGN